MIDVHIDVYLYMVAMLGYMRGYIHRTPLSFQRLLLMDSSIPHLRSAWQSSGRMFLPDAHLSIYALVLAVLLFFAIVGMSVMLPRLYPSFKYPQPKG